MRYLPHTDQDIKEMLAKTGYNSLDDLFPTIPKSYRVKKEMCLPKPLTEWELNAHMAELSSKNASTSSHKVFIGAGSYPHHIPSIIPYLISRSEFMTAYTPYQPEISQGTLQGIYEFQTMITELLGTEVATASHYDCGTALSEALMIALRKKKKQNKVAISSLVHPHHRQIVKTYLEPAGYQMVELPSKPDGTTDLSPLDTMDDIAAVAVQSPNFFGCIENLGKVKEIATKKNIFFITSFTEALAYGLLKNPGHFGVDIVAGEGQSFGIAQSFGGPGLGIMTSSKQYVRDLPGRLVGRTKDRRGEDGFVLTLSTREQHIKREKASSNICSNNGLNAMTAAMYMATLGKVGIRKIAQINHDKAMFLKTKLEETGFKVPFATPFFNEFVVKAPDGFEAKRESVKKRGIVAGLAIEKYYPTLKNHYLFCATEVFSKDDIEMLARELK
ncbi:MAG: aminomethyl-transferring glycine dehydrogenase subunit GcvPA [Desulfamplus sp.]|nr:aminomethyl-transferring glycine dehydrogenase subunit GcvPA [Desulfamplus sp.]